MVYLMQEGKIEDTGHPHLKRKYVDEQSTEMNPMNFIGLGEFEN